MGERIRSHDWNETHFGPVEGWSPTLRSALSICLNSGFPIAIYWGPRFLLLYNDAWSAIPGDKHPRALGKPGPEVWPEIWPDLEDQFRSVLREGDSIRVPDSQLFMNRFGYTEECYFDYTLSPIFNTDGTVGGVFNAGIETTFQVLGERRSRFLHRFVSNLSRARTQSQVLEFSAGLLEDAKEDIAFALLFKISNDGETPQLVHKVRMEEAHLHAWPFLDMLESGMPVTLHDLRQRIGDHSFFWPDPCTEAMVIPLRQGSRRITGFLVVGASPRKRLDDEYVRHLETIGLHMSTSLTQAGALEQEAAIRSQLVESEGNLRRLFMQASVGICILRGEDFYVELVNDAYLEIVQRQRMHFENRPVWEGLPEVRDQGFDKILRNVLATGESFVGKEQPAQIIRNGHAETVYVDFVYEALRDGDAACTRIMALVIDVTDKVLARRAVEVLEERARLAVDSADLGTFDVDLNTNHINASPRMAEIMGIGHSGDRAGYVNAIHPDDLPIRAEAYKRAYESGYLKYETRVIWEDGSIHWCRFKGRVYFDAAGKPQQLLGVVQDITEVKEFAAELTRQVEERTFALQAANAELGRRNVELEQFAYVSSHDLQEPLRKIRMFSELIREQEFEKLSPASRTRFEKVTAAADRMSRSLRDLLEYASLEKREQLEPVDLNEVVGQVCVDLELLITQQEAHVDVAPLPTLPAIPLQMQQLFYNLVNNALKFSRPGLPQKVRISCSLSESGLYEFRVSDEGIGFDQQNASRIFTIFQRLHDRASYTGSGIGLALCKKVVENHGGTIRAEGKPGEGATFIFTLPA
jgi:PAS domain S-box-containing protein